MEMWSCDDIHMKQLDVFAHPYPNIKGDFYKLPLDLEYGWVE